MATVLVVDDSPVSQRLLGYTLQRQGYTVIMASDGQEALDLLKQRMVDLIISDLAMPGIDGLTLLRQLRAEKEYQKLQIIILTASGQDQYRYDAQAAGVNDFLTKPTSSRDLIATVNRLIGS